MREGSRLAAGGALRVIPPAPSLPQHPIQPPPHPPIPFRRLGRDSGTAPSMRLQGHSADVDTDVFTLPVPKTDQLPLSDEDDDNVSPLPVKLRATSGRKAALDAAGKDDDDEHRSSLSFLDSIVASAENWALCEWDEAEASTTGDDGFLVARSPCRALANFPFPFPQPTRLATSC